MDRWHFHDSTLFRFAQDGLYRYFANEEGDSMWVYSRYITKNGVRIYRKDGKVFRFWVDDDVPAKSTSSEKDVG